MFNSKTKSENAKHFTRGGQIILNNLRMFNQVSWAMCKAGLWIFFALFIVFEFFYLNHHGGELLSLFWLAKAWIFNSIPFISNDMRDFTDFTGHVIQSPPDVVLSSPALISALYHWLHWSAFLACLAIFISVLLIMISSRFIRRYGEKQASNQVLRGDRFLEIKHLAKRIKKEKQDSELVLGGLPMIKNMELRNFFLLGAPGTGKTQVIRRILNYIRARGERAIVYDNGRTLLPSYFDESQDKILNPLDVRCANWDLWKDCQTSADFDAFSQAVIAAHPKDEGPFWELSSRTLISVTSRKLSHFEPPLRSVQTILSLVLGEDFEQLRHLLKGTEAEALLNKMIEKTSGNVKAVLVNYLRPLRFLIDIGKNKEPFSIQQWIQDDRSSGWIFLPVEAKQEASLRPILSVWMDLAIQGILGLSENLNRRVWVILDEAASLQRIPMLTSAFSQSRKFGGCFVVGVQSFDQLIRVYGQHNANDISNNLGTRFFFRAMNYESADWAARNLGQCELKETQESYSMGTTDLSDRQTLNPNRQMRPVITPSEIMQLPDMEAYVRLPGNWPITKVKLETLKPHPKVPDFCPRTIDDEADIIKPIKIPITANKENTNSPESTINQETPLNKVDAVQTESFIKNIKQKKSKVKNQVQNNIELPKTELIDTEQKEPKAWLLEGDFS